jgi:putative flippase GtrA
MKVLFHPGNSRHISQLFRYGMIGIAANLASYLVYLIATSMGGTPKLTMSVLYIATAIVSYLANKRLTFRYKGGFLGSGIRFSVAHFLGYLINFGLLYILVDKLGYPHQVVQVCAIVIVAAFLFVTFKLFVFKEERVNQSEIDGC